MQKKSKQDFLLVHKDTYLMSLQALGYYLNDLTLEYFRLVKEISANTPEMIKMKDHVEAVQNFFSAFDASLKANQDVEESNSGQALH